MKADRGIAALLASGGVGLCALVLVLAIRPDWPKWASFVAWCIGFLASLLVMSWLFPFKCPRCRRKLGRRDMLGREAGDRVRYICPECEIEWDTGLTIPHGD